MNDLLERLSLLKNSSIQPEMLASLISKTDFGNLDFKKFIQIAENADYTRVQLMSDPFDVELMIWPPSKQSAIHMHSGFWGHVIVLQGTGKETIYKWNGRTLSFLKVQILSPFADMHVRENSVHSVQNVNETGIFVTLHIYYPPQEGMQNTVIFDTLEKRIGVLNKSAKSASWNEPEAGFDSIKENAFEFIDEFSERPQGNTN
jgi:predicted metal-dependent enzyme (double-stranded beta helix superfamily)